MHRTCKLARHAKLLVKLKAPRLSTRLRGARQGHNDRRQLVGDAQPRPKEAAFFGGIDTQMSTCLCCSIAPGSAFYEVLERQQAEKDIRLMSLPAPFS